MNKNYTNLTLAILAILITTFAPIANAQNIGDRYISADFTVIDIDVPGLDEAIGGTVSANVPLTKNLDALFAYNYSELKQNGVTVSANTLATTAVGYITSGKYRTFLSASAGWLWLDLDAPSLSLGDDSAIFAGALGIEAQITKRLTLAVSAGYTHVEQLNEGMWLFGASASYRLGQRWFFSTNAAVSEDSDTLYSVGTGIRF